MITLTKENHTFGEWKEVVAATTTEAGKKERSCVCGYKETADIPKLDVQTPETPAVKTPKKGDKVSDDKKTGSYIIISSEKKEVAYKAPANKNAKTITIRSKKLTSKTVSKKAFKGLTKITTIKVPRKKLTTYKKLLKKKGLSSKVKVKGYK